MRRLVFFSLTVCLVAFAPQAIYAQPATPGNFTVKSDDTLARLSWSGSAGASYNIQRSRTPGGPYALLINVGTTSYNDGAVTNGGACFYVVAAVSNAVAGANSPEAAAIPLGAGAYHIVNRLSGLALDDTNGASNVGLDQ